MQKISLKLNKNSLKDYKTSSYTNKNGETIEQYDLELVMNKEEVLKTGPTWELVGVGFVTGKGVKQEDGKYSKEPIFGNATQIRDKKETAEMDGKGIDMNEFTGAVDEASIPF